MFEPFYVGFLLEANLLLNTFSKLIAKLGTSHLVENDLQECDWPRAYPVLVILTTLTITLAWSGTWMHSVQGSRNVPEKGEKEVGR